jgi:glutaredoxin 3
MHLLLYTWSSCSFCARAKALLAERGLAFDERALEGDRALAARLEGLFGRATMPYVLVDGEPLGGLLELERALEAGELAG